MERLINTFLFRCVELVLGVPLWQAFRPATCLSDCIHLFLRQSELAQIGSITIVAIMVKTLYRLGAALRKATRDARRSR